MYLITKWFGCFLLDEYGEKVEMRLFDRDSIPGKLRRIMKGEVLDEERELAEAAVPDDGTDDSGCTVEIVVTEKRLAGLDSCMLADLSRMRLPGCNDGKGKTGDTGDAIVGKLERALDPVNFGYDPAMLTTLMENVMAEKERASLSGAVRDALISAAFHTLEDMRQCSNLMSERLEEWHQVFSTKSLGRKKAGKLPEAIIHATGERETSEETEQADVDEICLEELRDKFGWENVRRVDLVLLSNIAYNRKGMTLSMKTMEDFIDEEMGRYAPNLSAIAGTQVGAALLATAGSLKRLAMFPAGTVQLLGAENAFFRFLKEGDRPPKHGFIYRIPAIRRAPRHLRGRLSRHYSTKISIATRMDFFSPQKGLNEEFIEKFRKKRARILVEGQKNR